MKRITIEFENSKAPVRVALREVPHGIPFHGVLLTANGGRPAVAPEDKTLWVRVYGEENGYVKLLSIHPVYEEEEGSRMGTYTREGWREVDDYYPVNLHIKASRREE